MYFARVSWDAKIQKIQLKTEISTAIIWQIALCMLAVDIYTWKR